MVVVAFAAGYIPTVKINYPLLKTLKSAAFKSATIASALPI